jgi:dTDP-4-amino-4,6-dideoxygalactose transaminase
MGLHHDGRHHIVGFHQRLDEMQAAVLIVKLRYLDAWNQRRQRLAALYDELLDPSSVTTPHVSDFATHVYYTYVVRTPRRDELRRYLMSQGIGSRVSYAVPVPLEPAYASLGYSERDIPVAANYSREWLCLPMFPELTEDQVRRVAAAVGEFFRKDLKRSQKE